jgi:hypothetical protein
MKRAYSFIDETKEKPHLVEENKTEIGVPTEEKKKTLNGFDMSDYVAHPIESKIVIERKGTDFKEAKKVTIKKLK